MADVAGDVTDVGACRVQRGDQGPPRDVGAEMGGVDPDVLGSATQQLSIGWRSTRPPAYLVKTGSSGCDS
jgi:hypothetical protein